MGKKLGGGGGEEKEQTNTTKQNQPSKIEKKEKTQHNIFLIKSTKIKEKTRKKKSQIKKQ